MIDTLSRWPVVLLLATLMASSGMAQSSTPTAPLSDKEIQKQAEKDRKAQEKADKEAQAQIEKERQAKEKAEKERLKNLPKNSDLENIGTRNINKDGPKLLGIVPVPGMMSLEDEIAMGRQLAADVDRQA